jgi:hypothetical protein
MKQNIFRIALSFGFGFAAIFMYAQQFRSPIDYPMQLAGNFGEPRPNHFHGGIDIKTDRIQGKPLFAIGDGYVSRVTVGSNGFGLAIYITNPCGLTSVYCHLKRFIPEIDRIVERYRYTHETYNVDIHLAPGLFPVAAGRLVGYSGDSGASLAPHLHLELHRTRDDICINPLPYFKRYLKDTTPPQAHTLMLYPKAEAGLIEGGTRKQTYHLSANGTSRIIHAWGWIGAGIMADDYMDGVYNRFGVYQIQLTVDGREVFCSRTDHFLPRENRMVNSWGDYEQYKRWKVWYMKSFLEPGNTLSMLHADANRGWVNINEQRDYHFKYTLTDNSGNSSSYAFVIQGTPRDIVKKQHIPSKYELHCMRTNILQEPGMQLVVPRGTLPDDITLAFNRHPSTQGIADVFTPHNTDEPLFGYATLALKPNKPLDSQSMRKCYIAQILGHEQRFIPSKIKNGWVEAGIRELGTSYTISMDTTPPKVFPSGQSSWSRLHTLRISVSDDRSGIMSIKGYVDNQFVPFAFEPKNGIAICRLDNTPIRYKGQTRTLRIRVEDRCGNTRENTYSFNY